MVVDIAALRCRTAIMSMPNGDHHVLFREAGRSLQLLACGVSLIQPAYLFVDSVIDHRYLEGRLRLLRRLSDLVTRGDLAPRLYPPDPRARRLGLVLQALDGRLARASYREIGVALFGTRRVEAEWRDPRRHQLDRVRRAVGRGRFLMQRGYLDFVRARA
jgi:hypothetical protein